MEGDSREKEVLKEMRELNIPSLSTPAVKRSYTDVRTTARDLVNELTNEVLQSSELIANIGLSSSLIQGISELYELVIEQTLNVEGKEVLPTPPTYANKTAKPKAAAIPRREKEVVMLLYPEKQTKDLVKDSDKIRKQVTRTIDPKKLKISISQVKGIRGGVLIKTTTEKERILLEEEITKNKELKGVKIEKPKKRNPKIMLRGVSKEVTSEELAKAIKEQNDLVGTLIPKVAIKRGDFNNWIVEVDPQIFLSLKKKRAVYLNWQRIPVFEHFSIL